MGFSRRSSSSRAPPRPRLLLLVFVGWLWIGTVHRRGHSPGRGAAVHAFRMPSLSSPPSTFVASAAGGRERPTRRRCPSPPRTTSSASCRRRRTTTTWAKPPQRPLVDDKHDKDCDEKSDVAMPSWLPSGRTHNRRAVVAVFAASALLGLMTGNALPSPALAAATTTSSTAAVTPDSSSAFFRQAERPFLTSPILEQYRIWDQEVADNLKYDGELERGDAANKGNVDAYPSLLVPILKMQDDLQHVQELVSSSSNVGLPEWKTALAIVSQPQYDTKAFKTIFNAYGDNIYYSDPDRANLYLGGGASPKNEQSLAYLLRNDLLTSIQNVKSELEYCVSHELDAVQDNDAGLYANQAVDSLKRYLALVPPLELDRARALLAQP